MTFRVGDVVQVTQDDIPPTRDRLFRERHPMFGTIGVVTEVSDHVAAFFNFGPAFPPPWSLGFLARVRAQALGWSDAPTKPLP